VSWFAGPFTQSKQRRILGVHSGCRRGWGTDVRRSHHPRPRRYWASVVVHTRAVHSRIGRPWNHPSGRAGDGRGPRDPYTGRPSVGGAGDTNWTRIAASTLSAAGRPVQFAVATQGSSGYVKLPGATGTPLPQLVAQTVKPDNRIVVAFDSVSDAEQSLDAVRSAATATYSQI